jgi:MinD-like ATPase involved in chromosome partitioning or flagellar assembly
VSVPVLTAVTDARWEADLVAALERTDLGVAVVRRCVDLADLLATAASGTARAALVSADLRRLDRDVIARLAGAGVAVVGVATASDPDGERQLRGLGVQHVVSAGAAPDQIAAAVLDAVSAGVPLPRDYADPRAAMPAVPGIGRVDPEPEPPAASGRVVAVWGPTGAPGRSTVAVGVAAELAALDVPVVLADADVYGGVVAQLLGVLDEAPGLAAAARVANNGTLDAARLAAVAREVQPRLRVLTGIARADRWPELRPSAIDAVLATCRALAAVTVVDVGFALEQDEELAYDTAAPRRNGATLAVLEAADGVLAVGSGDPVGLQRLVRGLAELREAVPGVSPTVVVNRVRRSAVGREPEREIGAALERFAGVSDARFVPYDREALDAAVAAGRTLVEVAPGSPARLALQQLAASLVGARLPRRRRGLARRG